MKIICRKCGKTTGYNLWKLMNIKGYLCVHCGFYLEKNKVANIVISVVISVISSGGVIYLAYEYFYWVTPKLAQAAFPALIMLLICILLHLLISVLMGHVINSTTRRRQKEFGTRDVSLKK